jgi:hypothetical protein
MIYPKALTLLEQFSKEVFLKEYQAMLIGGTAIAYHLGHRVSFDLDIAFVHDETLPELSFLKSYNATFLEFDSHIVDTAINEGGNIDDYHKRFSIDGVKVDFVVNPSSNIFENEILKSDAGVYLNSLKITSLKSLFKLKSLLLLDRNKIRDMYDVVYLLRYSEFEAKDILETIKKYRITYTDEEIIRVIASKKPDKFDIEFEGIVEPKMDMFKYEQLQEYLVSNLRFIS